MREFVMGDIHGELQKLLECLGAVNFNYKKDRLIQIGDVVDRGPCSYECVEELLKIENLITIKGNHDDLFFKGLHDGIYTLGNQGCKETLESYIRNCNPDMLLYSTNAGIQTEFAAEHMPIAHYSFFKDQLPYHIDKNNNLFVHGGFDRHHTIASQLLEEPTTLWWDRDLWLAAMSYRAMKHTDHAFKIKDGFREIFIGHTPTTYFDSAIPLNAANIWNVDTGSGKGGELTIMNINTKEYYQSTE